MVAVRGASLTVRSGQLFQLCAAGVVLLSFLAIHIVECAATAGHVDSHSVGTAAAAGPSDGSAPPDTHHGCDHGDGHEHDAKASEVSAAPPRAVDQTATAARVDTAATDWSMAGVLLLLRVRRRPGVECYAASPHGRDLLTSVCVSRK